MSNARLKALAAMALAISMIGGVIVLARDAYFGPKTITAFFTSATGIYPGDEVRVVGVKIGTIDAIEPAGSQTRMTLLVDRQVPIPADAKAVIVAQSLISSRYVQLAPTR
jgi:ABC-type transporter Mla subunit MlaD